MHGIRTRALRMVGADESRLFTCSVLHQKKFSQFPEVNRSSSRRRRRAILTFALKMVLSRFSRLLLFHLQMAAKNEASNARVAFDDLWSHRNHRRLILLKLDTQTCSHLVVEFYIQQGICSARTMPHSLQE